MCARHLPLHSRCVHAGNARLAVKGVPISSVRVACVGQPEHLRERIAAIVTTSLGLFMPRASHARANPFVTPCKHQSTTTEEMGTMQGAHLEQQPSQSPP